MLCEEDLSFRDLQGFRLPHRPCRISGVYKPSIVSLKKSRRSTADLTDHTCPVKQFFFSLRRRFDEASRTSDAHRFL